MCDNDEDFDDFDYPGAEIGGYNLLYPCDPIGQADAMFSGDSETVPDTDPRPATAPPPILLSLLRILLFLFCLALRPIWPALWLHRPRRPR